DPSTASGQPRSTKQAHLLGETVSPPPPASMRRLLAWQPSNIVPSPVAQVCFLGELDHLPVGDEVPLCVGRVREEAAADRQLAPIGSCRLLGNPGAVDPLLGNQSYSRLEVCAGAITESLEHAATDLELLLWIDLAHRH